MINIPPRILLSTLTEPCILFFKDINFDPSAPPHFYVTLPIPQKALFVISIITSQVKKRIDYYAYTGKKEAINSLVFIDQHTFSFLTSQSIIDCNRAEFLTLEDFILKIDNRIACEMKASVIPKYLIDNVVKAICESPLVPSKTKNIILSVYG